MFLGRNTERIAIPDGRDFIVPGLVRDVVPFVNASDLCIAPLRYGSGTRLKILEWMACGRTIISTRKAAEGIEVSHMKDIIIEDDIARFSQRIKELIDNPALMMEIGENATALMKSKYDWKISISHMRNSINNLL